MQSIFFSSFFLCLQGQSELCGSYHLLQSCFSFFVRLCGQTEPFGSCIILHSCSSLFFHLHGQPEVFVNLSFLSNSFSSPCFNLLKVSSRCFSLSVSDDLSFPLVIFWLYLFRVLSSAFLSSVLQSLKLCLL